MTVEDPDRPGLADYRSVNREGWDLLSLVGDPALVDPVTARAELDPSGTIPWDGVRTVLCVAGGGGEQGPRFAALGYQVTVADLSAGQLDRDRQVAEEQGLVIETVQADMLDLSPLAGRRFDLVYQPISACYVPDVAQLYRQVAAVTEPGGHYVVEHWSPTHLQVSEDLRWDGTAYRVDRPATSTEPVLWRSEATWSGRSATCLHYVHTFGALVGGLCEEGFDIVHLREPDRGDASAPPLSEAHMAAYFPPFVRIVARRRR